MLRISKYFTILYILTSFVTKNLGESDILLRLTLPDIFGGLAVISFILSKRPLSLQKHSPLILLVFMFLIGGIFGENLNQTIIEVFIHFFLLLMFYLIIFHFNTEDGFRQLILIVSYASISASFIGIYDLAAEMTGLPRVFEGRAQGEIVSGFRNAGQAGAYALVMLTIIIPVQTSQVINDLSLKKRQLIMLSSISLFIFFLLSGKIAAYIGFIVGLLLFFFYIRSAKALFITLILAILFTIIYLNIVVIAPDVAGRIIGKYNTRVATIIDNNQLIDENESFIAANITAALLAFEDRPLTGSGLGAFVPKYHTHEVHSTYFKMLGETGLLGVIGYLFFLVYFFRFFRLRSQTQLYGDLLYYMYPFVIGCFVSWSYTYHLRKREFWLLFAFVVIINNIILMRQQERNRIMQQKL